MTKRKILIANGPNLGILGQRQPDIYGTDGIDAIIDAVRSRVGDAVIVEHLQTNHEGVLIDALNAKAHDPSSLAVADAVAAMDAPVVEVHISNVHAREDVRRNSLIAPVCRGVITGFGIHSYVLAADYLMTLADK